MRDSLTAYGYPEVLAGQLAVPVVNLFSDLAAFDVQAAAYLLPSYSEGFPPGTVFLCVVDPGVGSERPAVILKADDYWYVGPNEGLFALVARRARRILRHVALPGRKQHRLPGL